MVQQLGSFVIRTSDIAQEDPVTSVAPNFVDYDNEIGMLDATRSDFRFYSIPIADIIGRPAFEKHKKVIIRCQQIMYYWGTNQNSKHDQLFLLHVSGHSPCTPEWQSGIGLSRIQLLCMKKDDILAPNNGADDKSITYMDLVCNPKEMMTLRFWYTSLIGFGSVHTIVTPDNRNPHCALAFTIHSID
jgi:hypothetical protein